MPLSRLALATGLIPIIAIHTTFLLSASQGYVDWCFPYTDSCASISATGRHGAAFYVFKGTMIPAAVLLALYWFFMCEWLHHLGDESRAPRVIRFLGITAAVFLVVYAVALGAAGDTMRLQRRIGIVIYFGFTAFCHLLLVWRLTRVAPHLDPGHWMYRLVVFMFVTGIATVLLDLVLPNYEDFENAFEWVIALAMHVFILLTAIAWRRTGFTIGTAVQQ